MEPPFWYYPVRQSLGAALLKSGDAQGAQKEFEAALDRSRDSAWALYGLEQAAKASGDTATESKAAAGIASSWRGEPGLLSLEKL
jgi:predicted Zn-dependent protease